MTLPRTKLLDRTVQVRDATIFVIATEGARTEPLYFAGFNSSRVKVELLPTGEDQGSSPDAVLNRLQEFRAKYDLHATDELWVVIDVDRWGDLKLRRIYREAKSRFDVAVSNPCFELWLYLHFGDADLQGDEWQSQVDACKGNLSKAVEQRFKQRLIAQTGQGSDKSHLAFDRFRCGIPDAIRRARTLDTGSDYLPTFPGTHVYRLAEKLLALSPTDLPNP